MTGLLLRKALEHNLNIAEEGEMISYRVFSAISSSATLRKQICVAGMGCSVKIALSRHVF